MNKIKTKQVALRRIDAARAALSIFQDKKASNDYWRRDYNDQAPGCRRYTPLHETLARGLDSRYSELECSLSILKRDSENKRYHKIVSHCIRVYEKNGYGFPTPLDGGAEARSFYVDGVCEDYLVSFVAKTATDPKYIEKGWKSILYEQITVDIHSIDFWHRHLPTDCITLRRKWSPPKLKEEISLLVQEAELIENFLRREGEQI